MPVALRTGSCRNAAMCAKQSCGLSTTSALPRCAAASVAFNINAAAALVPRRRRCDLSPTYAICPGPARSRSATPVICVSPAPRTCAPNRRASSASVTGMSGLLLPQLLEYSVGQIDALAGIDSAFVQDQIVGLLFRDFDDRLEHDLLQCREFLVATQIVVFTKLLGRSAHVAL